MSEPWKIKIVLQAALGPRTWTSKDIRSKAPGWGEERFLDPIESMELPFHDGRRLLLKGFQQYNFNAEGLWIAGENRMVPVCVHFYGRFPGCDRISRWDLDQKGLRHVDTLWGREYLNMPTTGWKRGVSMKTVISSLVK
ncbi:MAG: hypothetical protein WDA41_07380 [Candidatus Neomarinimicrobiota bacterium]